jgi:tRNA (guanine37-N1)-methyltransferase
MALRIDILSCVPALLRSPLEHSIVLRAQKKGLVEIGIHNIRDYATDKHKSVDDYPYGGGSGMVMRIEPIAAAIRALQAERVYDEYIYLTPDGETLTQSIVNQLSTCNNLLLLAGHYKGVDQRVRDKFITREISIGDYVLSGGELPALVLADAIIRLVPGVLSDETSALEDSFQDRLLEAPIYTRPPVFEDLAVPDILLSGHFAKIDAWRDEESYRKTAKRRPDLLANPTQTPTQKPLNTE